MKTALITGVLGQDGSYLAEHLLSLGYEVWGTVRRDANPQMVNFVKGVNYQYADLRDQTSLETIIRKANPDEIYNLAGVVFVPTSWLFPATTFDVNVGGLARIMDCIERQGLKHKTRIYQASTSEMYGNTISDVEGGIKQLSETSPMRPVSPYGVSKHAAHELVQVYRQKGFYIVSGILFNHESPRRGPEMVTRKITKHIAKWIHGDKGTLELGNIDARRDWGFAGDYVKAMHLMLQQSLPDDFVIGTGKAHSVTEFLTLAVNGHAFDRTKCKVVSENDKYKRDNELYTLIADAHKAQNILKWKPETTFEQLVKMMVDSDCKALEEVCIKN